MAILCLAVCQVSSSISSSSLLAYSLGFIIYDVLSCVQLFVTPWAVAHQAPLSMGILQARMLEWVAMPSSRGFFSTQGLNPGLLHCKWILYHLSHQRSPYSVTSSANKDAFFQFGLD